MTKHHVLVVGSGGREHALAWALSRSPQVKKVFVAPGNAGTDWAAGNNIVGLQPGAEACNVDLGVDNFPALIAFAQENAVSLTVVGPEVPLAAGIVDAFQAAGLAIFGPSKAAAQLEASKAYAKEFMCANDIPTGEYGAFSDYYDALTYLSRFVGPVVVKADGLAAGKGVLICENTSEAEVALQQIMQQRAFGTAGDTVVIEECLSGPEISVLAFADGKTATPMLVARDHKRALDGDLGLNTGGMGAFAPTVDVPQTLVNDIVRTVIQPAIDGMTARGTPYIGILYAGLMLTGNGPKVLEFNCRFGDPETQVILPLLETDLYDIFMACIDGRLADVDIRWRDESCATVVLASPGYPESYPKGLPISGLESLANHDDVIAFHAGTARQHDQIVTSGGRVMAITALGAELPQALQRAYHGVQQVHFNGMHYRRDIGTTRTGGAT